MKIKIEIKNRFTGKILFEFETENNTTLKTLKEAVAQKKDLTGADLTGADLRGADLRGVDLRGADLTGADLTGADLTGSDLTGSDLRGADLRGSDLTGSDLRGSYLTGSDGEQIKIANTSVFTGLYKYIAMPIIGEDGKQYIRLGCYTRLVSGWEKDFWNNNNEFPNDGNLNSQLRLLAYNTCKSWLELNK